MQPIGGFVGAGKIQPQTFQRDLLESEIGRGADAQSDAALYLAFDGVVVERDVGCIVEVLRRNDFQRP